MLEKTMRKTMIKKLDKKKIKLQPIESSRTGIGILDIFYRSIDSDGWIELKCIKDYSKKESIIEIPWRPGQMNWIKDYRRLNGRAFLFLHIKDTLFIFKSFYIKEVYISHILPEICEYQSLWEEVNWYEVHNILNGQRIYY